LVSSVTYNGISLTKAAELSTQDSADLWMCSSLWYLIAPATGANTLAITWGGSCDYHVCGDAISLNGVDQTSPLDGTATAASDYYSPAGPITVNVTTGAPNSWVVDGAYCRDSSLTCTVGSGQTERSNRVITPASGNRRLVCSTEAAASAGAVTMSWSLSAGGAPQWVIAAAGFKEAASGNINLAGGAIGAAVGAGSLAITNNMAAAAVARAVASGALSVHKPLTGAAIGAAVGSAILTAFSQVWRVPTTAPNGTSVHVIVMSGSSPTYGLLSQGTAVVAGGYADLPGAGSVGTKAFGFVHNYSDNTATTSIRGGPSIATLTAI
jgi:hypothetical protein